MALYDPSTCSYRSFCGVAHKSEGLSLRGGRAGGSPHKFTILKQQLIVNYFSRIHPHAGRNSRVKALKAELSSLRYSWFLAFVTLMIHDSFTFFVFIVLLEMHTKSIRLKWTLSNLICARKWDESFQKWFCICLVLLWLLNAYIISRVILLKREDFQSIRMPILFLFQLTGNLTDTWISLHKKRFLAERWNSFHSL